MGVDICVCQAPCGPFPWNSSCTLVRDWSFECTDMEWALAKFCHGQDVMTDEGLTLQKPPVYAESHAPRKISLMAGYVMCVHLCTSMSLCTFRYKIRTYVVTLRTPSRYFETMTALTVVKPVRQFLEEPRFWRLPSPPPPPSISQALLRFSWLAPISVWFTFLLPSPVAGIIDRESTGLISQASVWFFTGGPWPKRL